MFSYQVSHVLYCTILLAFLGPLTHAAEPRPSVAPIAVSAKSVTWEDVLKVHMAWAERVLVQPMLERTNTKPWSSAAAAYACRVLPLLSPIPERLATDEELADGRRLLKAGCADPLIVYLVTRIEWDATEKRGENWSRLEDAFATAKALPGPKALAWFIARDLGQVFSGNDEVVKAGIDLTWEVMKDGSYARDEDRLFVEHLLFAELGDFHDEHIEAFARLEEPSPLGEWVRLAMRGQHEVKRAWISRGSDWSDSVKSEQWSGFNEHLEKARAALTKAWELCPDRPEPCADMIAVVTGGGSVKGETERLWFDRAVAAQFDYIPAYQQMLWAYRPRWGGSLDLMLAFGEACLETRRYDTLVPRVYNIATFDIASGGELDDWRAVYRRPDVARNSIVLSQAVVNEPKMARAKRSNTEYLAINAWLAGDFALAAKTRAEIPGPLSFRALSKLEHLKIHDFDALLQADLARDAEDFKRGEALLADSDSAAALTAFRAAAEKAQGANLLRARQRIALLEFGAQSAAGAWVAMTPRADDPAWFVAHHKPIEPDGWINPRQKHRPSIPVPDSLCFSAPLGDDFELRWEPPTANAGDANAMPACELMMEVASAGARFPFRAVAHWFSLGFRPGAEKDTVVVSLRDFRAQPITAEITVKAKAGSKIHVMCRAGKISCWVDGQAALREQALGGKVYNYPQVFCSFAQSSDGSVPVEHLEIRLSGSETQTAETLSL